MSKRKGINELSIMKKDMIKHLKKDMKDEIKELHSRITTVTRELHERIDQVEHHITSRIDDLRSDLIKHKENDKVKIRDSVAEIEKWKWMILGGVLMAGFLLGKLQLPAILSFIK